MNKVEYEFFDNGTVKVKGKSFKSGLKERKGALKATESVKLLARHSSAKRAKLLHELQSQT